MICRAITILKIQWSRGKRQVEELRKMLSARQGLVRRIIATLFLCIMDPCLRLICIQLMVNFSKLWMILEMVPAEINSIMSIKIARHCIPIYLSGSWARVLIIDANLLQAYLIKITKTKQRKLWLVQEARTEITLTVFNNLSKIRGNLNSNKIIAAMSKIELTNSQTKKNLKSTWTTLINQLIQEVHRPNQAKTKPETLKYLTKTINNTELSSLKPIKIKCPKEALKQTVSSKQAPKMTMAKMERFLISRQYKILTSITIASLSILIVGRFHRISKIMLRFKLLDKIIRINSNSNRRLLMLWRIVRLQPTIRVLKDNRQQPLRWRKVGLSWGKRFEAYQMGSIRVGLPHKGVAS